MSVPSSPGPSPYNGSLLFSHSPRPGSIAERSQSRHSSHNTPSIDPDEPSESTWQKHTVMVKYLHGRIVSNMWFESTRGLSSYAATPTSTFDQSSYRGVLLRVARGTYVSEPAGLAPDLVASIQRLNVAVAFTMSTEITNLIFSILGPDQTELVLPHDSTQYQILDSFEEMAKGNSQKIRRFQYTCFVRRERVLLLWGDDVEGILTHASEVERQLLTVIWGAKIPTLPNHSHRASQFSTGHNSILSSSANSAIKFPYSPPTKVNVIETEKEIDDPEALTAHQESIDRPLIFMSAIFVGMATALITVLLLGFGVSQLLYESLVDGQWIRLALVITCPAFGLMGLFFSIVIFTDVFQVIGPITGVVSNSRCYSAIRPDLARAFEMGFTCSHVTIQMPVYKESLTSVIIPTVTSLKAAISHYELNGGTASIFINDDGLQLIPEEEAQARRDFYTDNNIGWVARPKHGVDGFIRGGKFKKASNMNYAMNISNKTEDVLREMIEEILVRENIDEISENEEDELYKAALTRVLEEDGRAWADGDIRIGEYILIIDSDTRVPADCLLYGAAEMFLSPEVGIVQHSAGVMQVVGDYFENGITFFTNQIYSAIRFAVGSGEAAPFVGHNAFLRWKAVQSVATKAPDGSDLFWSEAHVSEDFDISLRMQMAGNIVRMASYHGDGFKEGVSLTVYDELSRWEKYAYGCNELVFNPMYTWPWKGPFTRLFLRLLWSNMQLSSKITILGYISTYYALAFGLPLTILNYFLIGWINGYIDKFYIDSWKIFVALLVVFSGLGNFCLAVLRYRLGEKPLISALLENFKWMPMFGIFFGGISFHLFLALAAHMFSINMEWGATAKEAVASNFFKEIPKIFKNFKWMYLFCVPMLGAMVFFGQFAPRGWEINQVIAIVPLAVMLASHMILPFALNPALMIFNY